MRGGNFNKSTQQHINYLVSKRVITALSSGQGIWSVTVYRGSDEVKARLDKRFERHLMAGAVQSEVNASIFMNFNIKLVKNCEIFRVNSVSYSFHGKALFT